jgi:hypothetical protein
MVLSSLSSGPNTNMGSTPEISITTVFESLDSDDVKSRPLSCLIKRERGREKWSVQLRCRY